MIPRAPAHECSLGSHTAKKDRGHLRPCKLHAPRGRECVTGLAAAAICLTIAVMSPDPVRNPLLARRFAAMLYDLLPLLGLWMLVAALFLLASGGHVDAAHPPVAYLLALRCALIGVSAAYFTASWVRGGQTIGMRAWRIRVEAVDGSSLPWHRALLRFAIALLSLGLFGLGYLWCLIDREGRAWHDLAAHSRMIQLPRG